MVAGFEGIIRKEDYLNRCSNPNQIKGPAKVTQLGGSRTWGDGRNTVQAQMCLKSVMYMLKIGQPLLMETGN